MNHVPLCCDHDLHLYRRLADYPFEQNHRWFFSNIGIQCRFVIKRGHIFFNPFRVKFIHLIPLPKCKNLMKIEGVCHPVISVCPFKWLLIFLGQPVSLRLQILNKLYLAADTHAKCKLYAWLYVWRILTIGRYILQELFYLQCGPAAQCKCSQCKHLDCFQTLGKSTKHKWTHTYPVIKVL